MADLDDSERMMTPGLQPDREGAFGLPMGVEADEAIRIAQRRDRSTMGLGVAEGIGDGAAHVVGEHGRHNRTCYSFSP